MVVTPTVQILSGVIAFLIAAFAYYLFWAQRKFAELEADKLKRDDQVKMKLAAYERLTLLTERSKLDSLISRTARPGMDAASMRKALLDAIREEYEYNLTQQLYVSPDVWNALTRMKDQNMYIINQVASLLPPTATASDLNKQLLQLQNSDENTTLNTVVLGAIQHEVRQLIG